VIAVLAALPQELGPLRRRAHAKKASVPGQWLAGGDAVLALTGMGRDSSERVIGRVLESYPVEIVISTGFAGALREGLAPGQLVASRRICAPGGLPDIPLEGRLLSRAITCSGGALLPCVSVTVPTTASTRGGRRQLALAHDAQSVDMESYWIARAAQARGTPCLVVRAILDTEEQEIPPLETRGGGPPPTLAMLAAFLRSPRSLALLPSLWRRSVLAADRLAAFLVGLLRTLTVRENEGRGESDGPGGWT
jgi:adenosylhomocysteine nucleosidase